MALARAVEGQKKRGGTVLIVAHRHGAFAQCDTVYVMENGRPVPATGGQGGAQQRAQGRGAPEAAAGRQPPRSVGRRGQGGGQPARQAPPAPGREGTPARAASGGGEDPRPPAPPARGRDAQIAGAIERVRGAAPPTEADESKSPRAPIAREQSAQARRPAGDGGRADAPASAASGQASESRDGRDAQIAGAVERVSGSAPPAVARENEGTGAPPAPERGEASSGNSAKRGDAS